MARKKIKTVWFEDLEPHHCRYAVTERLPHKFCGKPRLENTSYCQEHSAIITNGKPKFTYFMHKAEEKDAA